MKKLLKVARIVVDILMFIVLIVVLITPYLIRYGPLERSSEFLGMNASAWHQRLGWIFVGLMVLHLALNIKWVLATTVNIFKVTKACKAQYIIMVLLIGFMVASVISGAMWGAAGRDASDCVRLVHVLTSWAAVWLVGTHMGIHFIRFLSFFESKKPKKVTK